jgi:hypothetical protein
MSQILPPGNESPGEPPVIGYATPSTAPTFAIVWCRVLALWMFAWGIETALADLEYSLGGLFQSSASQTYLVKLFLFVMQCLPAILWLSIAWYCWRKAPTLALRMTREQEPVLSQRPMSPDELLSIITMGIGIYLLAEGLTGVTQAAVQVFENTRSGERSSMAIWENHLISIARCILGLWLILGTHGVVTLLRRHGGKWRDDSKIEKPE